MIPLIRKVRQTIAGHQMFTSRDRILVGVSGGADSTALLLALRELGYDIAIAHLNHGLRGADSDEDERFVANLATQLGVPCFTHSEAIGSAPGNIEAAGREARKKFFDGLCCEKGFTRIALAHNREDRVETFLLHLLRGAGSEGLVSMTPVAGAVVRPLIEASRAEIEEYLQSLSQGWRTDRSNEDMSFARNRMRREILPQLASLFNTQLVDTLSRTISILQDEDQWMGAIAESWLEAHPADGLDVAALRDLPRALTRRLIRNALRREGSTLTDLTFAQVEAVRGLLDDGKSGKTIQLPGKMRVSREFNRLVFSAVDEVVHEFDYSLSIPGAIHIPELNRLFRATCLDDSVDASTLSQSSTRVLVDGDRLGSCVKIRSWKPGDYYKPTGWPAGKVKKLFQRARVPRSQRSCWPLFTTDSTIIWVTSFPVSREFTPSAFSKKIVAFEALEG